MVLPSIPIPMPPPIGRPNDGFAEYLQDALPRR